MDDRATAKAEREARLAAALRGNLKRRKAAGATASPPTSDAVEPALAPRQRPDRS